MKARCDTCLMMGDVERIAPDKVVFSCECCESYVFEHPVPVVNDPSTSAPSGIEKQP